ncbi:hypothetical protein CFC35_18490 [Streptomyces sp. FBKL.4005]|nr:hypothetical protein CFC35_18490 [Streptomyces sp. FBKL.4005]
MKPPCRHSGRGSTDAAEAAAYEETIERFERAAVFGSEARELLLRVMKGFRALGDTLTSAHRLRPAGPAPRRLRAARTDGGSPARRPRGHR